MDQDIVIAKIRRWQAELGEMIAEMQSTGKGDSKLATVLKRRVREIDDFISTISDRSHIPRGDVDFEPGSVIQEIDAKVKGDGAKVAFDARFLLDVLSVLDKGEVTLGTTTPSSPGVFRSEAHPGYTHVVMPMFVQW